MCESPTNVVPFKRRQRVNDEFAEAVGFLRTLILDPETREGKLTYATLTLKVSVELIKRSYEGQRLKYFSEHKSSTASALTTLIASTPALTKDAMVQFAELDLQLWNTIPHVETFITGGNGHVAYNFRTKNHEIAQVLFQLT